MINAKNITAVLITTIAISFTTIKNKAFIPPGTVQITETFFADEVEICNFAWQEYEFSIISKFGKNSKEHLETLPDTIVWLQKTSFNEPYVKYYYRHPAYKDYPVVGISYEQAVAFCKWRTERVKTFYYIKNKKEINIEYRLPTKAEWEMRQKQKR
jgi:formylglycine-generating enzyme required for sulfatase activity